MPGIPVGIKLAVELRAKRCCEYCQSQNRFSPDPFSIEHIISIQKGGSDNLDNLAYACQGCNNHKYSHTEAIYPLTGKIAPLFHPRRQSWSAHFMWSEDFTNMVGLTPSGRATIERLQLNRTGVVNLRSALRTLGEHPLPE